MPKNINEITIFVASPKDVVEERESLEEIIKEMNAIWNKQSLGMRLNLVRWETSIHPDMGTDAQSVINDQIDDYDIFIGIMWKSFGTPTGRAGSGTVEEFENAYQKYKENPNKIKIMFYFNDAPIPMSEINAQNITAINGFKEKLGEKGDLYWIYNGPDEFSNAVRRHLSLQVPHWQKIIENQDNETSPSVKVNSVTEEEDDEGFFELLEMGNTYKVELDKIMGRMTDSSNSFAEEIEVITSNNNKLVNPTEIQKVANNMAVVMDNYASNIEKELPDFSKIINKTLDAYSRATLISTDFYNDKDELNKLLVSIQGAKNEFITVLGPFNQYKKQLAGFPRITKPFNKSKKHTLIVIDSLASEINNAVNMMSEVEKALQEVLTNLET
ncbi:MAG: DUF4062 domain-containing protein [Methanobacterium paludis]|nr:DUF4062 domain-containing protein [Methanobacterium paludis]